MTSIDLPILAGAAFAGGLLGAFFFGGLWWTVRATVDSSNSAWLQLASLVLRMAVTLSGFHLAGGGDVRRLLACLAGFVLARLCVARWVRGRAPASIRTGASHAARP